MFSVTLVCNGLGGMFFAAGVKPPIHIPWKRIEEDLAKITPQ